LPTPRHHPQAEDDARMVLKKVLLRAYIRPHVAALLLLLIDEE
jgi:hypothetical protein